MIKPPRLARCKWKGIEMDDGLPCDRCGQPTYMYWHVGDEPTLCRSCNEERNAEMQKAQKKPTHEPEED